MGFLAPVFTVVSGFLGTALGKVVVGLGLNLLVSKLQNDRAKKSQKAAGGTQFDREYGENVSRKVACGPVGLAGHDCYVNTYGSANANLEQVYVFSDFPCDGLVKIWAGGTELAITLGLDGRYAVTSGDYAGRMFFTFYDGTQTTADAGLIANSNPSGRWTAAHVGNGMCWLKVELIYDQEKLSQFPDFFFELRGARLYDIRKDSTAGGSGAHRWGNYSTYEYSENPIIMDYNYRRGFSWNGDLFLGMDMPASDLPFDQYVTAANICDEFAGGERRYRCSILLDADLDHGDNIDALMTACGGIVIDGVEGSWPLIGTEQPIVFTFTDDDLVAGERVKFRRRRSMADLVNVVSGTYQEPANMWSPAGYDPQTDAATVAADRRGREIALNFPQVFSKRQANQLASIYFNENRYERTADMVLRPGFRSVRAGDWVYWNSANESRRGVYMVQSRSIRALDSDGPRNVALSLQERDGSIYAGVGVNPPAIPLPNGDPVYLNELQDWAIVPVIATGADGRSYAAFRMSWTSIVDVTVTGIQFEWWIKAQPANKFNRQVRPDQVVAFLQEGIVNTTEYDFRHKLIADRVTNWSNTVTVMSLDGGNDSITVGLADLRDDVKDRLAELQESMDIELRPLIADLMTAFSLEGAVGEVRREEMTRSIGDALAQIIEERRVRVSSDEALAQSLDALVASVGNNLARLITEETARATATDALSQQITQLTAKTATDIAAAVQVESQARATADTAMASNITQVQARVDDVSAGGYLAIKANTSGANLSSIEIAARATLGSSAAIAALILDVVNVSGVLKSRMKAVADQFIVMSASGGDAVYPFAFENGELVADIGRFRKVVSNDFTLSNGTVIIDLNGIRVKA